MTHESKKKSQEEFLKYFELNEHESKYRLQKL